MVLSRGGDPHKLIEVLPVLLLGSLPDWQEFRALRCDVSSSVVSLVTGPRLGLPVLRTVDGVGCPESLVACRRDGRVRVDSLWSSAALLAEGTAGGQEGDHVVLEGHAAVGGVASGSSPDGFGHAFDVEVSRSVVWLVQVARLAWRRLESF